MSTFVRRARRLEPTNRDPYQQRGAEGSSGVRAPSWTDTRHHARTLDAGSYWRLRKPALLADDEFIAVAKTRAPTFDIDVSMRWGKSLRAVGAALPTDPDGAPPRLVDACLIVPRLNAIRHTAIDGLQCPNVLYRRLNATHWRFEESRALPFKARPL